MNSCNENHRQMLRFAICEMFGLPIDGIVTKPGGKIRKEGHRVLAREIYAIIAYRPAGCPHETVAADLNCRHSTMQAARRRALAKRKSRRIAYTTELGKRFTFADLVNIAKQRTELALDVGCAS